MSKTKLCDKPEQNINYFDHVPDEILYKIVLEVPRLDVCTLAKASQRFQKVCGDKRLWNCLSLIKQQITHSQIEGLFTSSFPIKELDLSWSWISVADYRLLAELSDSHMTLEKLNLTSHDAGDSDKHEKHDILRMYILKRSRTKELILNWTGPRFIQPKSNMIEKISRQENLEVLSMNCTDFNLVSVDDIMMLLKCCSRLRELYLVGCILSPQQLRAFCDYIPVTVEKLVLLDGMFRDPGKEFWTRHGDYENYLVMNGDALAESLEVLSHRAKNLKYFGTPMEYFRIPAIRDRMIECQSLETLHLCEYDWPYVFSVLEKMAPKLKKIDIFSACTCRVTEEIRVQLLGSALAQLERFREAFIGIDLELYDAKMNRVLRPHLPGRQASVQWI